MDLSILERYRRTESGRYSFARISSDLPLPHLMELQRRSYQEFLQMDLLPEERQDVGLQAVFKQIFPIVDYRGICQLDFVDYTVGVWECLCGHLKGLEYLRATCSGCGARIPIDPEEGDSVLCPHCGTLNREVLQVCPKCQTYVHLKHRYTDRECKERGATYSAPLRVRLRLSLFETPEDREAGRPKEVKEQLVYFGEIPLMTEFGTFIINGTERVIVSQLHRSPGAYFRQVGRRSYLAEVLPYYGAWIELMYDRRGILHARIDRRKKVPGTVLLKAFGLENNQEILKRFYRIHHVRLHGESIEVELTDRLVNVRVVQDVVHPKKKGHVIVPAMERLTRPRLEEALAAGVRTVRARTRRLFRRAYLAEDVVDPETGEVLAAVASEVTPELVETLMKKGILDLRVIFPDREPIGDTLVLTMAKDKTQDRKEALREIFRKLRPGDQATAEAARIFFEELFWNPRRYSLGAVGRLKLNTKLGMDKPLTQTTLDLDDICRITEYALKLQRNLAQADDIDSLANRRVRAVGELLQNQLRVGLSRMERYIKERLSVLTDLSDVMPGELVNTKMVMASVREFFATGQLSQFMDQTNPLAEITHKRRLSALGPGGLNRERAGFEVRDVHPTHYGRVCPIETPEGPNIGLIVSLSCYARVNEFGFIESPYRKVENGRVVDSVRILHPGDTPFEKGQVLPREEVDRVNQELQKKRKQPARYEIHIWYMTAWEEAQYVIAQATVPLDEHGRIVPDFVIARKAGEIALVPREEVQFIDVSPKQVVSVSASLIPFLEHDDANRALMGSNMERQAVPLMKPEPPIVSTGMEAITARDSGAVLVAEEDGVVEAVDATRIVVRSRRPQGEDRVRIYKLRKLERSNQGTCITQRPIVRPGQEIRKGQVIADGPATAEGELSLGRNVLVAYMPWHGYNFEDAIVISERLVEEDAYTSIHIEEFEVQVRETKIGEEQLTRDVPKATPDQVRHLDDTGIAVIGSYVKPGDILVGKVTPQPETVQTPEERLIAVIFGEKGKSFTDSSLRVPPGVEGVVVDVKVFARRGVEKDPTMRELERIEKERLQRDQEDQVRILRENVKLQLATQLAGAELREALRDIHGREIFPKGHVLRSEDIESLEFLDLENLKLRQTAAQKTLRDVLRRYHQRLKVLRSIYEERIKRLEQGDELPPGVLKVVKVYVAMKRRLQVGDKMAGRHGNKGVVAIILPKEDMPFLPDGTPVDIVLNPLGVPSRMNVGQLLEANLGWAAHVLGVRFESPVFDGAREEDIRALLRAAGLPEDGKTVLYDGRTGEPFEQRVTVGYAYMMKLIHMAEDKIHARATGPYSLITQQPLGGKARFGGQRLGEMEVWALEAYGAAHTLQEMLTVKSDDIDGRLRLFQSILRGHPRIEPTIPESFRVLMKELQSLALDVELVYQTPSEEAREAAS